MKKLFTVLLCSFVALLTLGEGASAQKKSLRDLLKPKDKGTTAQQETVSKPETKEEATTASKPADQGKIDTLIRQLGSLKKPEKLESNVRTASLKETALGQAAVQAKTQGKSIDGAPITYITTTQKFKASAAFDQQILLNPGTDVIYPGSVLLGHTIASGTYQEVTRGQKREITVSYDLTNIKGSEGEKGRVTGKIVPTLSNYRALHNRIMGQNMGKASTTYSFEETMVSSEEDFGIKFNVGVGFNSGVVETNIKSGFDFGKGSRKYKYMVKFMETFYTVDVNQGQDTFLYENFNVEDFKGYRPVYVASIAYGRLAYLTIESDETWDKIKADLDVAVDASLYGKYSANVETSLSKLKKNSKINITVIGGASVATSLESFLEMLKSGGFSKDNPGKIIAYKLRFVDDNAVANTVYNDEYTVTKTEEKYGEGIDTTFTFFKIKANANDGSGGNMELFGNFEITYGKDKRSFWSFPRAARKKYKERGEFNENASFTFRSPNENASFDLTLFLMEADGKPKDDDAFTNAGGTTEGNMPKTLTLSSLRDGEEIVIRVYAIAEKRGRKEVINSEWVEFYVRVNKKYLY